jgi:Na+-translocating ferredoxin:NAD+ oxidoreductase RnfD subunit
MTVAASIKTQLILSLTCFALFLASGGRETLFLAGVGIAVISSIAAESIILYVKSKVVRLTESSIITGLIVGFVVASDAGWWKIALASLAAIISKHVIRYKGKHIFNPAGFGIFLLLIAGVTSQWKGTYLWYILLPFGAYFSYKIRKLELLCGYAVVALGLFGAQALAQKIPLWDIFGYLSFFYIFVMIVEPRTTPVKPAAKYLFGAGVAALIFILTESGARFDVELLSLLAMNLTVPFMNRVSGKIEGGKR